MKKEHNSSDITPKYSEIQCNKPATKTCENVKINNQ